MLGLPRHLLHQPGALDDIGKTRVVFDVRGDGELAAGLEALEHDRLQPRARAIDSRAEARGSGPEDEHVGLVSGSHGALPRCDANARLVDRSMMRGVSAEIRAVNALDTIALFTGNS